MPTSYWAPSPACWLWTLLTCLSGSDQHTKVVAEMERGANSIETLQDYIDIIENEELCPSVCGLKIKPTAFRAVLGYAALSTVAVIARLLFPA